MKRLIIGSIPSDFSLDKYIPAAPYCFLEKEDIFPEFLSLNFYESADSTKQLADLDESMCKESLRLVLEVAERYNPNTFDKHSAQFWKTIYYPWLGLLVPFLYRNQLLFHHLVKEYGDSELTVSITRKEADINFIDDFDFLKGVNQVQFSEWILSQFIESALPSKWIIEDRHTADPIGRSKKMESRGRDLKKSALTILDKIFSRSKKVYGFDAFDMILFNVLSFIKPKVKVKKTNTEFEYPNTIALDWNIDVMDIIDKVIPLQYKSIPLKNGFRIKGKLYNYSNLLFYNFKSKVDAAYAFENQNLVITTQHGGHNYGSALTFDFNKYLEYDSDYFISWGWDVYKEKKLKNFILLPSPLLSKYRNQHKATSNQIIMVGTDMNILQSRFESRPSPTQFLDYRTSKTKLIELILKQNWKENFAYKPYPDKEGSLKDKSFLTQKFESLKIIENDLHSQIKNCKLLILDHPGTTWNIAMVMNVPTILFWKRDWFPFGKEADAFLERLKKVGIYYEPETVQELVDKISKEHLDINAWWQSKEIQTIREEWMNEFAFSTTSWRKTWIKTLWKLK